MYYSKKERHSCVFSNFKGVDYAHAPANISPSRSADGLNMVRSEVGKVRKRTGYYFEKEEWPDNINGVHFYNSGNSSQRIVHCGKYLYTDGSVVYTQAADTRSRSIQAENRLFILDGKKLLVYDGKTFTSLADNAYIPTVYINRKPDGGGQKYEQANILTEIRREAFISDGNNEYNLSAAFLGTGLVTAVVYNDDETVNEYTEGNGITVNRKKGVVRFSAAPAATKYTDESNVYITYSKAGAWGSGVLDKCTVAGFFGRGGKPDTLFLSGHPDYPGREWFSVGGNPFFFGEDNTDSGGATAVIGYSTKGDMLFVHRKNAGDNMNIMVRKCSGGNKNFTGFPVVNMLSGPSARSGDSFVNMANDALFLTEKGIYAITESEGDERHYVQLRSFYINPRLAESNMSDATAVQYDDFYVIGKGNDIFLLDTLQKSHEEDKEYSHWQYECYHWKIPHYIKLLFIESGQLCFVTRDRKIGRFYTDYDSPASFNDDGQAVKAVWQTGDFTAGAQTRNKSIHYIWVVCAVALHTGVDVMAQVRGVWTQLFEDSTTSRFFKWSALCWSKFTWSTDKTPKITARPVKLKNIDKTAIRLENSELNEPFGIYEIGFDYTLGSYYR